MNRKPDNSEKTDHPHRRTILKGTVGAGLAIGLGLESLIEGKSEGKSETGVQNANPTNQNANPLEKRTVKLKGNIKQSIVYWCFNSGGSKWDAEQMCKVAHDLGCGSIELIEPQHWETLKKHKLTCAIAPNGMPGAPFKKGFNNTEFHAEVLAHTKETIDLCATAGFPNVIAFTGYKYKDLNQRKLHMNSLGLRKIMCIGD